MTNMEDTRYEELMIELKQFIEELDADHKNITRGCKGLVSYAQYNRNIKQDLQEIIDRNK